MIIIEKKQKELLLEYSSDDRGLEWVHKKLREDGRATLRKTFTFTENDILEKKESLDHDDEYQEDIFFILGKKENNYYRIKASTLDLENDLYLAEDMDITPKTFIAHRDISIFGRINKLVSESIYVGGDEENAIPIKEFEVLLSRFPTTTEVTHYARSRISMHLKDYLGTMTDAQAELQKYLKKKPLSQITEKTGIKVLYQYEVQKYEYIRDRIREELTREGTYSEKDWQNLMLQFILLIFPKYVAVLRNVHLKDFYSKKAKTTPRYVDIALVDANGNIDVIEIKKPFKDCLVSGIAYRDNFIPKKELAGAIMQAEKYIFHLSKWGVAGEMAITQKHVKDLPKDMEVKVTNPKALIILGRSQGLSNEQIFDLELIRRKYTNIMDIITYDDLISRLDNIIEKFKSVP
jgi:hypothetical protein